MAEQKEMFSDDEMGVGADPGIMSDEAMVSVLITKAHWTTKEPWTQIARRLQFLSEKYYEKGEKSS